VVAVSLLYATKIHYYGGFDFRQSLKFADPANREGGQITHEALC